MFSALLCFVPDPQSHASAAIPVIGYARWVTSECLWVQLRLPPSSHGTLKRPPQSIMVFGSGISWSVYFLSRSRRFSPFHIWRLEEVAGSDGLCQNHGLGSCGRTWLGGRGAPLPPTPLLLLHQCGRKRKGKIEQRGWVWGLSQDRPPPLLS